MSLAIDGLVSGLNTTSLINSLMQVEAMPQVLLKNKVTATQSYISAMQNLNGKIASLATLAATTAKPDALELYSATSSSDTVTATAAAGASAGSVDFVVDSVAQAQNGVSAAMTVWPDDPPALTIVSAAGNAIDITPASTSLDDVVTAVNAAGAGVTAVKVASGTDATTGEALYRLQFTATSTGEAGAFTVYRGTSAQVADGTATDLLTETGAAITRQAQDASVRLWVGTTAEQTITSATNTFTDLLPGVSITVSAASADPVTVSVTRDDERIATVAEELVTSLNEVFSFVAAQTAVTSTTSASGSGTTKAGLLTGDSTVRSVNQRILAAASAPVDGRSPSEIGISITRSGAMEFDDEKFAAAMAKDPAGTQAMVQAIAARVEVAATEASDKYDGQLTAKITGQEKLVGSLEDQVLDWDRRLESRRSALERIYSGLEVSLSRLNSQSSWLTGQLSSLSSS